MPRYYISNEDRIAEFMTRVDDADLVQDFFDKIVKTDTCWLMMGGGKYPTFKNVHGHIASWILYHGAIPKGKLVLHKCDVFHCVNPDHLYLGTRTDNAKDAYRRGQLWQEKALDGNKFELARYAYVEMGLTQKQIASLFKVGEASVGRALNGMKRGRYTKRNKK